MSPQERASILLLLDRLDFSSTAIEIGCYTGGFLRQLVATQQHVFSIDLDHKSIDKTHRDFGPVKWFTGNSKDQIPLALAAATLPISFILIDGDHSYNGVSTDLYKCLEYIPTDECVILVHDSWYGPSRKALLDFPFKNYPYVHFIDLDFCTGTYANGNWVGGLALIHLLPTPRVNRLEVRQSDRDTYRKVTK
jgi:hypothetical protein